MLIWIVLIAIALLAIGIMIIPLWRKTIKHQSREAFDEQIYRDQLTELNRDLERNRITPEQAVSARTEIARRLLAVTEKNKKQTISNNQPRLKEAGNNSNFPKFVLPIFLSLALPIAAFGVYMIIGSPHLLDRFTTEITGTKQTKLSAESSLITELGARLQDRPNDLRGWKLYAQSLTRVGRLDEAVAAYRQVLTLVPLDPEQMSRLAEVQIFAAKGQVTPAARASLEAVLKLDPTEPRARYYLGLTEAQAGRIEAALSVWLALEADLGPEAPMRKILSERIVNLAVSGNISADQVAERRKWAVNQRNGLGKGILVKNPNKEKIISHPSKTNP